MNEIDFVLSKSSKQILSLAKGLKGGDEIFDSKLCESLIIKDSAPKVKKKSTNERFKEHPNHFSSDSDILDYPVQNGFKDHTKDISIKIIRTTCSSSSSARSKSSEENKPHVDHFANSESSIKTNKTERIQTINRIVVSENNTCIKTEKLGGIEQICPKVKCSKSTPSKGLQPNRSTVQCKKKENEEKLAHLLQKTTGCLEDIKMLVLRDNAVPDGQEDYDRRRKRAQEFSTRFSRIYLYNLHREVDELKKLAKKPKIVACCSSKMFVNAHQTLMQTFQAYQTHIPTSLGNMTIGKLKTALELTEDLCCININHFFIDPEETEARETLICVLQDKSKDLLEVVDDLIQANAQRDFENFTQPNPISKPAKQKKSRKNSLHGRLSMYSLTSNVTSREAYWKKAVEALAEEKLRYNYVHSRYKTAGFKHRPPKKRVIPIVPPIKRQFNKQRRNTPLPSYRNEDDIPTMVEMETQKHCCDIKKIAETGSLTNNGKEIQPCDIIPMIKKFCAELLDKNKSEVTHKCGENFINELMAMALTNKIDFNSNVRALIKNACSSPKKLVRKDTRSGVKKSKSQPSTGSSQSNPLKSSCSKSTFQSSTVGVDNAIGLSIINNESYNIKCTEDNEILHIRSTPSLKFKPKQTISVTGTRNARLIYIKDEGSIIESSESNSKEDVKSFVIENEGQGDADERKLKNLSSFLKIKRISKVHLKPLRLFPKNTCKRLIQYKLGISSYTSGNHIYRSSQTVRPWVTVNKIADGVLDILICFVSREIQVDNVIQALYHSELQ